MKKSIFLLLWSMIVSVHCAFAYKITGTITDEDQNPLPYATIYLEGTTIGTTSNNQGIYSLDVKTGNYKIMFRFTGYQTVYKDIAVDKDITLDIQLFPEIITLRSVEINADYEDPAYQIIRNAQNMRSFYENQLTQYSCDVYIKNMQYVSNVPKKFMGEDIVIEGLDKNRSGIVYLSESVSRYYFKAPSYQKEVMISSKVSGSSKGFSMNNASMTQYDFYQKNMNINIGERPFMSPIAPAAMLHYNYKHLGEFKEKGVTVHKIQISPKVNGSPCFMGIIYIQEESWRIHAVDFLLTQKTNNLEFIDSLRIKQTYVPYKDNIWVRSSQSFEFLLDIGMFGLNIKGKGSYIGVSSKYDIVEYKKMAAQKPSTQDDPTTAQTQQTSVLSKNEMKKSIKAKIKKVEKIKNKDSIEVSRQEFDAAFLKGETKKVADSANTKTDAYWESIRPIPLTELEKIDYVRKDSIEKVITSKPYQDSIDAKNNKFKWNSIIFGYNYSNRYRKMDFGFPALLEGIQFNTVEGFVLNPSIDWSTWNVAKGSRINAELNGRYGFSSKKWYSHFSLSKRFNKISYPSLSISGGTKVEQFNANPAIKAFANTLWTLLREENYMKLYEKQFGRISFKRNDLLKGIHIETALEYAHRLRLMNAVSLPRVYIDRKEKVFSSNNPLDVYDSLPSFRANSGFFVDIALKFRFKEEYTTLPNERITNSSPYPKLNIYYRKAIPSIANSSMNYDKLHAVLTDEVSLGIMGRTRYELSGGTFLSKKRVEFMDYTHFNTTQILFAPSEETDFSFFALPYYAYSTTNSYLTFHLEHHFNGYFTNSIPLFKKLNWQLVGGSHTLLTKEIGYYTEITVGMEHIFKFLRVDYVAAFQKDRAVRNAVRISAGF